MLLEFTDFQKDVPYRAQFINVAQEDFHFHDELEIILVLKGTTHCKIHNVLYNLKASDVLIVDTTDMHRIFGTSKDAIILSMHIDVEFFLDLYPSIDYMIFACEDYSKTSSLKYRDLQKKVSVLKSNIAKTAVSYLRDEYSKEDCMVSLEDLIFNLVNQFQGFFIEDFKFKAGHTDASSVDLARLYEIIKYIYLNYDKKITLDDLADLVYLNPYYVSHLIKSTSGLSFQNFLNYVRLEFAEKLLVENQLSLTQVAGFCGFSSLAYFNKCFKTWYSITPAQYRNQLNPCERTYHPPFEEEEAFRLLENFIVDKEKNRGRTSSSKTSQHIFIPVKYDFRKGYNFKKSGAFKLVLSTREEIYLLSYLKDSVLALCPSSIILDQKLLSDIKNRQDAINLLYPLLDFKLPLEYWVPPKGRSKGAFDFLQDLGLAALSIDSSSAKLQGCNCLTTVTEAVDHLLSNQINYVSLSSSGNYLVTREGLFTPLYYGLSLIASIDGDVTEKREQYMIIKEKNAIHTLIFHHNQDQTLKAHIHVNNIQGKLTVIKKTFNKENSCFSLPEYLREEGALDEVLRDSVNHLSQGKLEISFLEAKTFLDIDMELEPEAISLISIKN